MISLQTPADRAVVVLETEAQRVFKSRAETAKRKKMDGELTFHWYDLERSGSGDRSLPLPVHFAWEFREDPEKTEDLRGGNFFLLVADNKNFSNPKVTVTATCQADVYNLEVGKRYYYCVQYEGKRSEIRSFRTKMTVPRWIYVDGISNIRDLGGFKANGKTVRQGLLYRGGEVERHMHISEKGVRQLQALGVKTNLDLRGESIGTVDYPLLPLFGIHRVLIPIGPYEHIFDPEHKKTFRAIFRLLADEKNYPIYYHCWGGADRTGSLSFVIGALLGMSEKDLDLDYELTSLSIWGLRSQNYAPYILMKQKLFAYPGETLAEKTAAFLKTNAGVTEKEIAAIRSIFLPEK